MIDNRTVGKTIAGLRQAKGMTQQQLAAAMNVSHQAVSKWENGAALPDIQTMVELTQLFGITVEQLISGDVPEARMESAQTPPAPAQSAVGSFVNGVINDIGNLFKSEPRNAPAPEEEEDGAQEAEVKTEKESPEKPENIDLQNLLQMAPFMSKQALEEMLSGQKLRIKMPDRLIEPRGGLLLIRGEQLMRGCAFVIPRGAKAGYGAYAVFNRYVKLDILLSLIRRLAGERAANALILRRHVLMPRKENIVIKLRAYSVPLVFIRCGKESAACQIALVPAVVYAYVYVRMPRLELA